jgi:hypothetical protein
MHIPPEQQNARVVLGHGEDRNQRDDTIRGGPRARAIELSTAVSASAARSRERDRRSNAIEPNARLAYLPN